MKKKGRKSFRSSILPEAPPGCALVFEENKAQTTLFFALSRFQLKREKREGNYLMFPSSPTQTPNGELSVFFLLVGARFSLV
jgi:hypothetical protein